MLTAQLRERTAALHQAMERRLDLLSTPMSGKRLVTVIKRFLGFYEPVEQEIDAYGPDARCWIVGDRRKTALLKDVLLSMGFSKADIAAIPRSRLLPSLRCRFEQLGCMYVLEGATLGGQIIHRALAPLGADFAAAGRFFNCYGDETGRMWNGFKQHLEFAGSTLDGGEVVISSASRTFESLYHWLFDDGVL